MMLLGLIWAAFAPLLLVVAVLIVRRLLRHRLAGNRALAAAVAIVLVPVAAVWSWQYARFQAACRDEGAAAIHATAKADGFLLTSGTANSFGMRYVQTDGFAWIEARDIYRRDGWVRYSRDAAGNIATTPIAEPTARYEVRETHESRPHWSMMLTSVRDRQTGTEMARASSGHFGGGSMKWVLGAWGSASCPNPMWDSAGFRRYYNLARDTLG